MPSQLLWQDMVSTSIRFKNADTISVALWIIINYDCNIDAYDIDYGVERRLPIENMSEDDIETIVQELINEAEEINSYVV